MAVIEQECERRVGKHAHVDDAVALGGRIRDTRTERGMSQRELSFPGCTAVYICRIERGDRVPSLQVIHELARRLHVSPEYIAWGSAGGRAPFTIDLDAEAIDAHLRSQGWDDVGLADLTPDETDLLRVRVRREAQITAGLAAAEIVAARDFTIGIA